MGIDGADRAGDAETAAGGDWLDAVALAGGDVPAALNALNAAASWIPGAKAATVCVVVLDRETGELSYCTAGHPAPLLVSAHGEPGYLSATGAVRETGSAGTRQLTVDLTGVSHLASAGVAALHRAGAAHEANGTSLRLYAPVASTADTILTLVELDHLTRDPHTGPAEGEDT